MFIQLKMRATNMHKTIFEIDSVIEILKQAQNKRITETKKVKPTFLDSFLFSGKFNSVLGLDGFQTFKDSLREVVKKVNADDFGENYILLDDMYQALLVSGVYYIEQYLPEELQELKKDNRWLTAYRYVAKNFPEIKIKDFKEIVRRFKDSDGHSFFIDKGDTESLKSIIEHKGLFIEEKDAKAALLQLSLKELKTICEKLNISAARSIDETVDRIINHVGESAIEYVPSQVSERRTFFIVDDELATGNDIIQLDQYLRSIAKVVRKDLSNFINSQRHGILVA